MIVTDLYLRSRGVTPSQQLGRLLSMSNLVAHCQAGNGRIRMTFGAMQEKGICNMVWRYLDQILVPLRTSKPVAMVTCFGCERVPVDVGPTVQVGATIYFCTFLVIASMILMALFMAAVAEYVSYDLLASQTAMISVDHLSVFQVCFSSLSTLLQCRQRFRTPRY